MDRKPLVKSDLGIFEQYSEETEDGRIMNFSMFQKAVKEIENRLLLSRQKATFHHLDERIDQLTIDTEHGQGYRALEKFYNLPHMGEAKLPVQLSSGAVNKEPISQEAIDSLQYSWDDPEEDTE
jgi:hypothetical protein